MASFAQKAPNIVRGAALAASFAVLAHAQDDDLGIPSHIQMQDQAQAPPVEVAVNTTSGDYALVVDGIEWVASSSQASPPTLNGHHLELSRSTATNGTDRFGAYTRVALEWTSAAHPSGASAGSNHSSQPKVLLVTTYSTYVSIRILSSSCRGGSWLPTAPPPILLGLGGLVGGESSSSHHRLHEVMQSWCRPVLLLLTLTVRYATNVLSIHALALMTLRPVVATQDAAAGLVLLTQTFPSGYVAPPPAPPPPPSTCGQVVAGADQVGGGMFMKLNVSSMAECCSACLLHNNRTTTTTCDAGVLLLPRPPFVSFLASIRQHGVLLLTLLGVVRMLC